MDYLPIVRVLDTDYKIKDEEAARINHTHKVEEIKGAAKEGHQHQASKLSTRPHHKPYGSGILKREVRRLGRRHHLDNGEGSKVRVRFGNGQPLLRDRGIKGVQAFD